jgi:nucleoprotein TPR
LKDRHTVLNEKIDQYLNQIQTLEEKKNIQQEDFLKELTAQKKLVDLYKMNLEDSLKHIERLEENLSSLTSSYTEQSNSHKLKLQEISSSYEEKFKEFEQKKNEEMKELEKQILEQQQQQQQLQKENNDSSNTSSSSSAAALAAAAAAGGGGVMVRMNHEEMYLPTEYELIGKGYSLTTMYCQVLQLEKDLNTEKLQKQELELYLDRILKDIESKAPMIASLRRDHMRLVESHDQLTRKLDGIINENQKYKKLNMKLEKECEEVRLESQQVTLMNNDLCKQIQHLLRYSSSSSGGNGELTTEQQQFYQQQLAILQQHLQQQGGRRGGTSIVADDVISEYLVTYETIEELQKRNIQLLSIVRKLSMEQEDSVMKNSNSSSSSNSEEADIQATLDQTLAELEMMRESRQRMEDMVSSLIQQRDIYRAMLEDVDGVAPKQSQGQGMITEGGAGGGSSSVPTTPTRQSSHKQMEALQMKLGEVRSPVPSLPSSLPHPSPSWLD